MLPLLPLCVYSLYIARVRGVHCGTHFKLNLKKTLVDVSLNMVIYQTMSSFVYFWEVEWRGDNETEL